MTTALSDPRTEQVLAAAEDICHIYCDLCQPFLLVPLRALCGEPLEEECPCDDTCQDTKCPMCYTMLKPHMYGFHPERADQYAYDD